LSCVYFGVNRIPTDWTIATPPSLDFLTAHSDSSTTYAKRIARTVLYLKPSDQKTSLFQQLIGYRFGSHSIQLCMSMYAVTEETWLVPSK